MSKGVEKCCRTFVCTFFSPGHNGMNDIRVIIIDKTNKGNPTQREAFWAYKLDTFVPKGLNVRDFE